MILSENSLPTVKGLYCQFEPGCLPTILQDWHAGIITRCRGSRRNRRKKQKLKQNIFSCPSPYSSMSSTGSGFKIQFHIWLLFINKMHFLTRLLMQLYHRNSKPYRAPCYSCDELTSFERPALLQMNDLPQIRLVKWLQIHGRKTMLTVQSKHFQSECADKDQSSGTLSEAEEHISANMPCVCAHFERCCHTALVFAVILYDGEKETMFLDPYHFINEIEGTFVVHETLNAQAPQAMSRKQCKLVLEL